MLELLQGVKVVDLTTIVLGPYATQILGDLGADVIKVEPGSGDLFRAARPGRSDTMGAGFLNCNRNKRSIVIDLKRPEGLEPLHCLLQEADVLVHNMRPQAAVQLGISYEQLQADFPRLIYCHAPGFGRTGRYANAPAYDDIMQALSGVAHLNSSQGAPQFLRTLVCDKVAGLHLAIAMLAGLVSRLRSGRGGEIEVPMFESLVSFMMIEQLAGLSFQPPLGTAGYERLSSVHRKPFRTLDGFVSILPYNSAHWIAFLRLIGRADLAQADWVVDAARRSESIDTLYRLIDEVTPSRTTQEWLTVLGALDIPCAPVKSLEELIDDPHLQDVKLFGATHHPSEGSLRSVRSPFATPGQASQPDRPAPQLGSDTRAILLEAGMDRARVLELIEMGVIAV